MRRKTQASGHWLLATGKKRVQSDLWPVASRQWPVGPHESAIV